MLLGTGQTATIRLTWDDTFGAATNDYDLYILDSGTGAVVAASTSNNPGTGDPAEAVAFTNSSGASKLYDIFIQNFANTAIAKTFDMFVLAGGIPCLNGSIFNYNTMSSSVPAQSDAGGGVVSVGTINVLDFGASEIASYSSRGPTNNGAIKPDVTAIDGVDITGSGGFSDPFFGTSAAAPHVAALAALLLELSPGLISGESGDDPAADRAALRSAIVDTAIDLGEAGVDNTYGSGRVNGLNAGQAASPPTATPTPTPVAIPSLSTWALVVLGVAFALLLAIRARRASLRRHSAR